MVGMLGKQKIELFPCRNCMTATCALCACFVLLVSQYCTFYQLWDVVWDYLDDKKSVVCKDRFSCYKATEIRARVITRQTE